MSEIQYTPYVMLPVWGSENLLKSEGKVNRANDAGYTLGHHSPEVFGFLHIFEAEVLMAFVPD